MLALPAPYGLNADGTHISLSIIPGAVPADSMIERVLREFGCHPPIIPRIISCLRYSRYDCYVQSPAVLRHETIKYFEEYGLRLLVE